MDRKKIIEIYETTEYDKFNLIEGNRVLSISNIKRLMQSVAMENLLEYNPIIVDREYYIIDGQHRLEVAKRLGKPIYYIIAESTETIQTIQQLNYAQKNWSFSDFLDSYCKQKNRNYLDFKDFLKYHNLSIQHLLRLMGEYRLDFFKLGNLKFNKLTHLELRYKIQLLTLLREFDFRITSCLIDVVNYLNKDKQLDLNKLNLKLNSYPHFKKGETIRLGKKEDYLRLIENVYNYGRKDRIRLWG